MLLSSYRFRAVVPLAVLLLAATVSAPANAQGGQGRARDPAPRETLPKRDGQLQRVASFGHQVTGVTVSRDGRIFVNFPRWTEDTAVSVAEVKGDGTLTPYPDAKWNAWRNVRRDELSPAEHWVCVQSVVADGRGNLWVLDPASPGNERTVKDGPKLVRIDLASNSVAQTIKFDERAAPTGSYLNDVRFDPEGRWAYLTDSGVGALLVVDLRTGEARRLLQGTPSTQAEKGVVVRSDGKPVRRPDGRGVVFAADGIALSGDGQMLIWQALTGKTLYSVPTVALQDASMSAQDLAAKVKKHADSVVADGLWMSSKNQLFVTSPEDNSVKVLDAAGKLVTVIQDPRLRWPDTMSEGPDGVLYVTASHIQDSNIYKPLAPIALRTELFRFAPPR